MTPINKQSKKNQKAFNAQKRTQATFNVGTRTMNTDKRPSRARQKELDKQNMRDYN